MSSADLRPPRPGTFRPPGLAAVFRFSRRRPLAVLAAGALVLASAIAMASSVRVETDVLSLIPSSNRPVAEFRATLERFGSLDLLLVALELGEAAQEGGDLAPALHFADLLAAELRTTDGVEWLEYRSDEARGAVAELVPYAPLFLGEEDLGEVLGMLSSDAGLERAAAELAQSLRSPASLAFGDLRRVDPLGMVARAWSSLDTEALDRRFDADT
ncbi:MAG: hypothetical protein MI919_13940, partial [Holophagales bacterium]|nr:hypothetical protein [Holophagales bacterium]